MATGPGPFHAPRGGTPTSAAASSTSSSRGENRRAAARRPSRRTWVALGTVAALVVAAVVAVRLVLPSTAGPKNMLSDGIVLTGTHSYVHTPAIPNHGKPVTTNRPHDGKAHIVIYEGMLDCDRCRDFLQANEKQLSSWLNSGTATVEIHPIAISGRSSDSSAYSIRATNALACVAEYDPTAFWAANFSFSRSMPMSAPTGNLDRRIDATLERARVDASAVVSCADHHRFRGWVAAATKRVAQLRGGGTPFPDSNAYVGETVSGVPTVIVNGVGFPDDKDLASPAQFAAFVKAQAADTHH